MSKRTIQRYLFVSHSDGVKHMFGELVPCEPCEAALCTNDEVVKLEVSHAQLLEALQDAIALYGKFGAIVNDPHNPGEWITKAQQAVRRATE